MALFYFVVGAVLGSFYLVVGTRLPKHEDIVKSRSRCDYCKKELKWYHLIPLFSYLFQKGKCTYCGRKISGDHFFVELGTGLMFLATYLHFHDGYNLYVGLTLVSLLILIFISDLKYMIILDSSIVGASILIIALKMIYNGWQDTLWSILWGICLFAIMYGIYLLGNWLFKRESLGGGDIKLAFVIGLALGLRLGLVAVAFSAFLALPYAVAVLHLNHDSELPYGPFLAGALVIIFYFYDKFMMLFEFLFRF